MIVMTDPRLAFLGDGWEPRAQAQLVAILHPAPDLLPSPNATICCRCGTTDAPAWSRTDFRWRGGRRPGRRAFLCGGCDALPFEPGERAALIASLANRTPTRTGRT
jgi:hypothetical protein